MTRKRITEMKNNNMGLKIILLVVAGIVLLWLASDQAGRWRFRRKVVRHFETRYPGDRFRFEGRVRKESYWAILPSMGNPTGGTPHSTYWYKYEGKLVSERLGMAFQVAGKPGRERSGGGWDPAFFHDTWTETPDKYPGWPVGQVYEDALEQLLADSVHGIWDEILPDLELRRDYCLTRDRTLYVSWWEAFRNLRSEYHVLIHRGIGTELRYEPMPTGPMADLHSRLHAQRNFDVWFFRDSANAERLTVPKIAAALERFARRTASEAGIDGTLRCTVIDRGPLMQDAGVWHDLFRKYHYDRSYSDWPEEHRNAYDAIEKGAPPTDDERRILDEVLGRSVSALKRLDKYVIGRYEAPFAANAVVRSVDLPADWTAGLDAALQEEMRRAFGRNAYGRFEPYLPRDTVPAAAGGLRPHEGWQATVYVLADSSAVLPGCSAAGRFAASLEKRTGIRTTVDVYCLSAGGLRYSHVLKNLLLVSDDLTSDFRDSYWLGVREALFREPLYPYKYVELSEFDYERINDPRRRQPDPLPDGAEEAFYRLMRPRADLDVMQLLSGDELPVILRHYRTADGTTSDLTDVNSVTVALLRRYEKRCFIDPATSEDTRKLEYMRDQFYRLLVGNDDRDILNYHYDRAVRECAAAAIPVNLCLWMTTTEMQRFAVRRDQQRVADYLTEKWQTAGDTVRQSLLFTLDMMTTDVSPQELHKEELPKSVYAVARAIHCGVWGWSGEPHAAGVSGTGGGFETDRAVRAERRTALRPLVEEALQAEYVPLRQQAVRMLGDNDKAILRDRLIDDPAGRVQCEAALRLSRMPGDAEALAILQERIRKGKAGLASDSWLRPDRVAVACVQALAGADWGVELATFGYQVSNCTSKAKAKALDYSFVEQGSDK